MAGATESELLLSFRTKVENAVLLVPNMISEEKLKAVQLWNIISEKLQEIVNINAADINALAMRLENAEKELPGMMTPTHNPVNDSKSFLLSPSDQQQIIAQFHQTSNQFNLLSPSTNLPIPLNLPTNSPTLLVSSNQETSRQLYFSPVPIISTSSQLMPPGITPLELSKEQVISELLAKNPPIKQKSKDILKSLIEKSKAEQNPDIEKAVEESDEGNSNDCDVDVSCDVSDQAVAEVFTCEFCDKIFLFEDFFKEHQLTECSKSKTKKRTFQCDECNSKFNTKGNLEVHRRIHSGVKPFQCHICLAAFITNGNLKRHIRTHSGTKPWICDTCGKHYTEKKSLQIHLRSHTGERPFQCHICLKRFTQSGTLQTHMNLHESHKSFLCEHCGKSFRQSFQLKLHKHRHFGEKRFNCSEDGCNSSFHTKGDLDRHVRVHTGVRPFVCTLCEKSFARQQSLDEHMNRHYGFKPYECKYCQRKFCELSACCKHQKQHQKTGNFSDLPNSRSKKMERFIDFFDEDDSNLVDLPNLEEAPEDNIEKKPNNSELDTINSNVLQQSDNIEDFTEVLSN